MRAGQSQNSMTAQAFSKLRKVQKLTVKGSALQDKFFYQPAAISKAFDPELITSKHEPHENGKVYTRVTGETNQWN